MKLIPNGAKALQNVEEVRNVLCLIRYKEAVGHDHMFLNEVFTHISQ